MDDAPSLDDEVTDETGPLYGKRIVLAGKLGGVNRREAQQLVN